MLFNSWEFIGLFLVVVLATLNALSSLRGKFCSYVFYGFAGPQYTLLLLFATLVDYNVGHRIAASSSLLERKLWLTLSLVVNLGMLAIFKYTNFLWRNLLDLLTLGEGLWWDGIVTSLIHALQYESLADAQSFFKLILPPGISFYTFQSLSYSLDVYRNKTKPESDIWKFACFVSLFPQLIAGPIVRYVQLAPQMEVGLLRSKTIVDWEAGIFQFSVGLCKKVLVADRIGNFIDPLLSKYHELDMVSAWAVMLGYSYQIYFDFSGYSDMAIGLGKMLGYTFPINFNSPYRAMNPSDFWARWHITLSQWMRDYLYFSLGGSKAGELSTWRNLIITMFLVGLWHGASWTFILWGTFHGVLLGLYHSLRFFWDRLPVVFARVLMFTLVVISWVPFRSNDLSMTKEILFSMFGANGLINGLASHINWFPFVVIAVAGAIAHLCRTNSNFIPYANLGYFNVTALAAATLVALVYMNYSSKFLYFNF